MVYIEYKSYYIITLMWKTVLIEGKKQDANIEAHYNPLASCSSEEKMTRLNVTKKVGMKQKKISQSSYSGDNALHKFKWHLLSEF